MPGELKRVLGASLCVVLLICSVSAQGESYFYLDPHHQARRNYQGTETGFGFRNPSIRPNLPHPDLETSDLPPHLQRTLPQYQIGLLENSPDSSKYQHQATSYTSLNAPPYESHLSRFSSQIIPSTHRPNYSHLFSKNSYNHDPSQTETFLGQITIQSPAELPPLQYQHAQLSNFQPSLTFPLKENHQELAEQLTPPIPESPSQHAVKNNLLIRPEVNEEINYTSKPGEFRNSIQIGSATRNNILNQRTRVFAPEFGKKPQVNSYFINNNGDVFSRTQNIVDNIKPKPFSINLDALKEAGNLKIESDITKSTGYPLDKKLQSKEKQTLNQENLSNENLNSPNSLNFISSINKKNSISIDNIVDNNTNVHQTESETDSAIEYSEIETEVPTATNDANVADNSSNVMEDDNYITYDNQDTTSNPVDNVYEHEDLDDINLDDEVVPEEERIVTSIVTTKSVINNTVIGTIPENISVTADMAMQTQSPIEKSNSIVQADQVTSPIKSAPDESSTDGWVVVASVQTSRSVSGARYLPSSQVEQHEESKMLSENTQSVKTANENANEESNDEMTTISVENEDIITTDSLINKQNSSTESLIDKLDRVQSDLSSGLLTGTFNSGTNNIAVITEGMLDRMDETTKTETEITTLSSTTAVVTSSSGSAVVIRKYSPRLRPTTTGRTRASQKNRFHTRKMNSPVHSDLPQADQPVKLLVPVNIKTRNGTTGRSSGITNKNKVIIQDVNQSKQTEYSQKDFDTLLKKIKFQDASAFVPKDYSSTFSGNIHNETMPEHFDVKNGTDKTDKNIQSTFNFAKQDDVSAFLPSGYQLTPNENESPPNKTKNLNDDGIFSSLLPKDYKLKQKDSSKNVSRPFTTLEDDVSALLPPGYKPPKATLKPKKIEDILSNAKPVDISMLLPKNYKPPTTTTEKVDLKSIFNDVKSQNISHLLPPDYKTKTAPSTPKSKSVSSLLENSKEDDISAFLPPGYKSRFGSPKPTTTTTTTNSPSTTQTTETIVSSTTARSGSKLVFPSRPGGNKKNAKLTTPRSIGEKNVAANTLPSIHKGWPSRATTEFTGWPTPSTTPISIEKLLEAARAAASSTSTTTSSPSSTTISTTSTTTTTLKPTTPGMCVSECDLAGTIKLIGGAKWVPELLDRNTKEWQILANEVQYQLDEIYSKSDKLNRWYKKIRIDGFSQGSILVDYLVELNNIPREINTKELKVLFHEALESTLKNVSNREAKASTVNEDSDLQNKLSLGNFMLDPAYTDFVVLPKQILPTVGYAENNVLLPQWAIAIIVIGLASLLFIIIFGVTVLVNKQRNAKKKQPSTLTEDMLNELDKNHMGGVDNYGADDLYNMEDVWNDRPYDVKPTKKRSLASLNDNSMPNIYDSWRSEWNGYYYNTYYGNHPGSSHAGYGRRRSDYDTNF